MEPKSRSWRQWGKGKISSHSFREKHYILGAVVAFLTVKAHPSWHGGVKLLGGIRYCHSVTSAHIIQLARREEGIWNIPSETLCRSLQPRTINENGKSLLPIFPEGTASLRTLAGVLGHFPVAWESVAQRMCSPSRQAIFIETVGIRLEGADFSG